jgi:ribonuclease E
VIDFIDMSEHRNQHTVERRMKEAMRNDRARIQIGRISAFGLLELSRQRLRPSLAEASTQPCPHCEGTGLIRSTESAALHVLRVIEDEGIRRRSTELRVKVSVDVALYILNQKRDRLNEIEARYGFHVFITGDDRLVPPAHEIERVEGRPLAAAPAGTPAPVFEEPDEDETADEAEETVEQTRAEDEGAEEQGTRRRRRRRRRGRKRDDESEAEEGAGETAAAAEAEESPAAADGEAAASGEEEEKPKRRRRGRRGGRRRGRKREDEGEAATGAETAKGESVDAAPAQDEAASEAAASEAPAEETVSPKEEVETVTAEAPAPPVEAEVAPVGETRAEPETAIAGDADSEKPKALQRKGWWNRFGS